jgi:HK97 family phage major capsid protein
MKYFTNKTHTIVNGRTVPLPIKEKKTMTVNEATINKLRNIMRSEAEDVFREQRRSPSRVDLTQPRGTSDCEIIDEFADEQEANTHRKYPKSLIGKTIQAVYRLHRLNDVSAATELQRLGIAKAMETGTDSEGGYMLPTGYYDEAQYIYNPGNLEIITRRIGMAEKVVEIPDVSIDVSATWTSEESALTESQPVLGQIQLTAKKLGAYVTVSNELMQDARPYVTDFLDTLFREAMSREIDNQILNGTYSGVSPCSGVLTAACGYSVVMGTGLSNFSSITASHLSEMIAKLKASVLPGCRFVMHPQVFHHIRTLRTTDGVPIFAQPGSQVSGTIYGYPYVLTDAAPSTSAPSTPFISFGNFRYFLIGDRMSLSIALDPYGLFVNDQTRIKWTRRLAPRIGRSDAFVRLITAS